MDFRPGKIDRPADALKDIQQGAGIDFGGTRRGLSLAVGELVRPVRIRDVKELYAGLMGRAYQQFGIARILEGSVVHAVAISTQFAARTRTKCPGPAARSLPA